MKIQYLEIKNYKQFAYLKLDLTYPEGHEKEGKPLDKICIIGQSGTGKTNLLNIIKKSVIDFSNEIENSYNPFFSLIDIDGSNNNSHISNKFNVHNTIAETIFTNKYSKINIFNKIEECEKNYFIGTDKYNSCIPINNNLPESNNTPISESDKIMLKEFKKYRKEIIDNGIGLLGANIYKRNMDNINKKIEDIHNKYILKVNLSEALEDMKIENLISSKIININEIDSWDLIKEKIYNYKTNYSAYISKLTNKLIHVDTYSKNDYKSDFKNWENKNKNILNNISSGLNTILSKFNLELAKLDENQQGYNDLIFVEKSKKSIIKYDNLSTGTKNLISTYIPLEIHNPQDSIILIDEPEISFYPDIQTELTDLYMDIGTNNQLIMATHSPLIASSFEPWEIVELKFDKNNQIYRELYYDIEKQNHIDNYTLDPRLLTWTSILTDIFDLKVDSNFTFREKALMEYASLKTEIKAIDNKEEKEEKFVELMKLSTKLGLAN